MMELNTSDYLTCCNKPLVVITDENWQETLPVRSVVICSSCGQEAIKKEAIIPTVLIVEQSPKFKRKYEIDMTKRMPSQIYQHKVFVKHREAA